MKRAIIFLALLGTSAMPLAAAGSRHSVTGTYVEARTAEVYAGGCVMSSEAGTVGKEAILAWKVDRGSIDGVPLDGLSIVAAVAGDRNLGIYELGGERAISQTAVFVDQRATPAQRAALVKMAKNLSNGVLGTIVSVTPTPIRFTDSGHTIDVATSEVALTVNKHMVHDPGCGAQQWFHPLASLDNATMGHTERDSFSGAALCTKWSDPNKQSSFFGTFSE
jgi:hypothetical protein